MVTSQESLCAGSFSASEVQSIECFDAGLLQGHRAGFDRVIEHNAHFRQAETLFNPAPPQGKRVATVLQVVNGRMNQLCLSQALAKQTKWNNFIL